MHWVSMAVQGKSQSLRIKLSNQGRLTSSFRVKVQPHAAFRIDLTGAPIDNVSALQTQLLELGYDLGRGDGEFGPRTQQALAAFQRDYGMVADGVCGPATLRALRQLGRRIVGGRPQLLREQMAVADAGPNLLGRRIVLLFSSEVSVPRRRRSAAACREGLAEADAIKLMPACAALPSTLVLLKSPAPTHSTDDIGEWGLREPRSSH